MTVSGPAIEIKFFGHAEDPTVNADKIWGWVVVEDKLYNFWGRRHTEGGSERRLKFKRHEKRWGSAELQQLARKKTNPSGNKTPYRSVPCSRDSEGRYTEIEQVYPGFGAHFKKQLMYARLTGTVKNEEV